MPDGTCGNFNHGSCSINMTLSIVQKTCLGSSSCSIGALVDTLGDPCKGVTKNLAVEKLLEHRHVASSSLLPSSYLKVPPDCTKVKMLV
ncbi:hypothetical protein TanjilG_03249 [Lupinus angustifolius]|uniref:SUEL-type lectin domain-containing protein n=1 Tax=Lupinus angustifolius TaxID=3871 RepID=A0A4P1RDI2_LUPAN|nr:hypothetical protein TanjilG_03249 [Lupinus angustifolius]